MFTIVDSKFKFESNKGNVIDKTQATFGQLAVALPDGTDLFTEIVECENGVVVFSITGEMIDEIHEVGFYSFHIRLYNDDKTSRITLPPVMEGIEIREPLIIEGDVENTDLVGDATVGYSMVQTVGTDEEVFDEDGNYIPTVWGIGDKITAEKLNKIEAGIKKDSLSKYIDYVEPVDFEPINIISDDIWSEKGYITNAKGEIISTQYTSHYKTTGLIKVYPGLTYKYGFQYGSMNYYIYDENKVAITEQISVAPVLADFDITIPSDGYYIALNCSVNESEGYLLPLGLYQMEPSQYDYITVLTGIKALDVNRDAILAESSMLSGKTIVNMGDSIFGIERGFSSISNIISDITGATVYNCGFGGARAAKHPHAGFDTFSLYKLTDSIIAKNFDDQTSHLNDESIPSYYSEQLEVLKNIDFENVDTLTIAYGTNDFTGWQVLDNPDNPMDTTSYGGALRYSIDKLLTNYPTLRIILITAQYRVFDSDEGTIADGYWMDGDLKEINGSKISSFNDKLKEVGKEFHITTIDTFNNMGWNKYNWMQYIPDGCHPSYEGRRIMAEYIAKHLY